MMSLWVGIFLGACAAVLILLGLLLLQLRQDTVDRFFEWLISKLGK